MKNYDDIYSELKNTAPLLSEMKKENRYDIPADYFLHFSQKMNEKVRMGDVHLELSEVTLFLAGLQKPKEETKLTSYFSALPENLLTKIREQEVREEMKVVAPTLSPLEKVKIYEIPANYFNDLPQQILTTIKKEEDLFSKKRKSVWIIFSDTIVEKATEFFSQPQYALAFASVVGLLIVGSVFWANNDTVTEQKIVAQMQSLEDSEVQGYLAMNIDEIQEHHILQNSSEVDFSNFLENSKEMNTHVEDYILKNIDEDAIAKELID